MGLLSFKNSDNALYGKSINKNIVFKIKIKTWEEKSVKLKFSAYLNAFVLLIPINNLYFLINNFK